MSVSGVAAWVRARLTPYPMDRCCCCRLPFNVGQQWQEVANDAVRVRFHAACYAAWRDEREAAARQALGLEGLNLPEARGRDVCAVPTLPVWPGPHPPPPPEVRAGTSSTMIAAERLIDRES